MKKNILKVIHQFEGRPGCREVSIFLYKLLGFIVHTETGT